MGKGDRRSKKGKIFRASFGNSRPHKAKTKKTVVKSAVTAGQPAEAPKKKAPAKKKKKEEE